MGVQACYDTTKSYSKPSGYHYYPTGYPGGTWLTTTSNCSNINLKPSTSRYVKVCFDPSSGSPYCQSSHTYAVGGHWTSMATDVLNGTKYKFQFSNDGPATGYYAG